MTREELGAILFLLGYVGQVAMALKLFGIRRVLVVLFGIFFLAVVIAFKTLGVITGSRR